jgi:hypothetical protein
MTNLKFEIGVTVYHKRYGTGEIYWMNGDSIRVSFYDSAAPMNLELYTSDVTLRNIHN